jgi:hypothetical protein
MSVRRETNVFSIAFLDLLSGALGAVIILYVAVPKSKNAIEEMKVQEELVSQVQESKSEEELELRIAMKQLQEEIALVREVNEAIKEELTQAKSVIEEINNTPKVDEAAQGETPSENTARFGSGFEFKGKNLIFIIDVSGSMVIEDRMGQVRSGLKMFLLSLDEEYRVDIVFYPDGMKNLYRPLWGMPKSMTQRNKLEAFEFLDALFPFGSTPTRQVLRYALEHYKQATDIILLSDGAPTLPLSSQTDNIPEILNFVSQWNKEKNVQISTIGVGSDMVAREKSLKYDFLNDLAKKNTGFFHPF